MKVAVLCFLPMALALATFTEKDNCDRTCGNMSVPFPFGLNESCARNYDFILICNHTWAPPLLFFADEIQVFDISVENGTITIGIYISYDCHDQSGNLLADSYPHTSLKVGGEDGHYTLSDTRNKLTVFGCDTSALISDDAGTFGSGCSSYCREDIDFTAESACSGLGCCQTSIPKSLRSLDISMTSTTNYTSVQNFSSCGSAFVVDQELFNVSNYKLPVPDDMRVHIDSKVVLDWVVERNLTCEEAKLNRSSYACGNNSSCKYFRNGQGYRCFCEAGYKGNPYAYPPSQGCQDINECEDPGQYPCHGNCKNKLGNYTCDCRFGMSGDGKVGCQISRLALIAAAIVAATLCIIVSGLVLFICKRRAKERYFRQNGGEILKHQRVKIFTEVELAKATNNYDAGNKLGEGGFASVYRGRIDGDVLVAVKKPRDALVRKPKDMNKDMSLSTHDEFLHEIGIISQVNHKNLVKLLGICLETKVPLLVYEFIPNGTLYHHIHDKRSTVLRSWKNCLKIASEAALALEYLHSLADPPVIHSDVKSLNILLDENYSAKVSDFGASVLISSGKTHIAGRIQGTIGYLDPECLITGELTTKSDVYSFGVILVELLTGEIPTRRAKPGEKINIIQSFIYAMENQTLLHMINFETSNEGELQEIKAVGSLARRCLNYNGMNRPTMREVAEQLARINKNLWADQGNDEETQSLLNETRSDPLWTSISEMNKPESTDLLVFDIEQATTSSNV